MDSVNPEETLSQVPGRDVWTIGRTLQWMTERFAQSSPTARLDAQLLLGHVLQCERVHLYAHFDKPLTEAERSALRPLVRRRMRGEPVAYILEAKEWHDLKLFVDPRVLIPRPETETLFDVYSAWLASARVSPGALGHEVESPSAEDTSGDAAEDGDILDAAEDHGSQALVSHEAVGEAVREGEDFIIIDLCTGSGCLALALARRFPKAQVLGVDLCPQALSVAARNAEKNNVPRVEWIQADVTEGGFWKDLELRLKTLSENSSNSGRSLTCAVVANPPYVSAAEWEQCDPEVRDFEPRMALVPAGDGPLEVLESIAEGWCSLIQALAPHPVHFFLGLEGSAGHPAALLTHGRWGRLPPGSVAEFRPDVATRTFPLSSRDAAPGEILPFIGQDLESKARFLFASAHSGS